MSEILGNQRPVLNFAQREGAEPLPTQLALREVSQELRARLWSVLFESMRADVESPSMGGMPYLKNKWRKVLEGWHLDGLLQFADDFDASARFQVGQIKQLIAAGGYAQIFKFVEYVINHEYRPYKLSERLNAAMIESRAAYRIIGNVVVAAASEADATAIEGAFTSLGQGKFGGARTHLASAGKAASEGRFADSVRESIHAVESASRILAPGTKTLGPALAALEKSGQIHGSLKSGFDKLYGFTSDEGGIRHALLENGEANVTEADALYMFGACAAFLTYLSLRETD